MFAKLRGIVDSMDEDSAVIDVGGVGYLVQASRTTLSALGAVGNAVSVHIETHVREDKIALYGFASLTEREWFRTLTTVQGVGAKVGLAILSVMAPETILTALAAADAKAFTRADGVGPKLGARIVSELKGKVAGLSLTMPSSAASASSTATAAAPTPLLPQAGAMADALSALINLGYGRSEAFSALAAAKKSLGDAADVSNLIKAGLKELSAL